MKHYMKHYVYHMPQRHLLRYIAKNIAKIAKSWQLQLQSRLKLQFQASPRTSIKRGFINGIGLTLVVAGVTITGIHFTSAQGVDNTNDTDTNSPQGNPIWAVKEEDIVVEGEENTEKETAEPTGNYAALGDSVAAGLGLPLTSTGTNDTQCGRSTEAYAYTVARRLNKNLSHYACSGATAGDLFTRQGVNGPNISPQLTQAYADPARKPELITITAGANDIQWIRFIQKCYAAECGTAFDTTVVNGYLTALQLKLYYMFYDIQARSGSVPPAVVITGYYNPLSSQCTGQQQQLTAQEINWVQGSAVALNQTIQNVVSRFSFARFAPVDFSGHDLCSADPWIQSATSPAPIHPTAAGQTFIAESVLRTLAQ